MEDSNVTVSAVLEESSHTSRVPCTTSVQENKITAAVSGLAEILADIFSDNADE